MSASLSQSPYGAMKKVNIFSGAIQHADGVHRLQTLLELRTLLGEVLVEHGLQQVRVGRIVGGRTSALPCTVTESSSPGRWVALQTGRRARWRRRTEPVAELNQKVPCKK